MPIFMDRHDLPESVTAEEVARLHQEDLKIEHKFGCKGMTYWFDEVRKTAFCLIQAPNRQALQDMHNEAHGAVANRIIEVEPSIVESFLGRIEDPVKAQNTELNIINDPAFRILMVVRNNQCISERYRNENFKRNLRACNETLKQVASEFDGTVVQFEENRHLVSFQSVSAALNCAQALIERFNERSGKSKPGLEIKIGLSSGLPFEQEEGLFMETVKKADRLCSVVEGQVVITSELRDLYESENLNRGFHKKAIRTLNQEEERFLDAFMSFMESSYTRADLKVEHFASNLGLSKAQLYRKVTGLTGRSLNSFLKGFRLEKALHLLLKRQGNISEIAFDTGFNSPAYFSKCFSQAYDLLPSELGRLP